MGMTIEELINFGEMFLEVNKDSKNSNTYEFIDAAVKLFKQESVLDKIRAEIEQLPTTTCPDGYEIVVDIDDFKENVLVIFDKYKAETEY